MADQLYQFGFDSIGNRTMYAGDHHPEYVKEYVTNELNQYTENSIPETFEYDLDGNMTQDGEYNYVWDAENRLIQVTPRNPSGKETRNRDVHFEYDFMGRRIRKFTYAWSGSAWGTTISEDKRFVYDGWNVVQEIDATVAAGSGVTKVSREYTWGLDLSGQSGNPSPAGIHGAGGIGGLLATHWTNNTTSTSDDKAYIYFYDANGNVGQMMDVVSGSSGYGTIAAQYEYYPFGGLLDAQGVAAEANPFRFSTKYRDNETGSYYYGYRYLRTKHGRWLNRDPIGEDGGNNLFCFVENNSINRLDVLGRETPTPGSQPAGGGGKQSCDKCGPDITVSLMRAMQSMDSAFKDLPVFQRAQACTKMWNTEGWDIDELAALGSAGGHPAFPSLTCGTGDCAGTVKVFGKCYRSNEVNYILLGRAQQRCQQTMKQYGTWRGGGLAGKNYKLITDPTSGNGIEMYPTLYQENRAIDIFAYRWFFAPFQGVSIGGVPPNKIGKGSAGCRSAWFHFGFLSNDLGKLHGCDVPNSQCGSCGEVFSGSFSGGFGFNGWDGMFLKRKIVAFGP